MFRAKRAKHLSEMPRFMVARAFQGISASVYSVTRHSRPIHGTIHGIEGCPQDIQDAVVCTSQNQSQESTV
jgi:hypothetical protein